LRDPWLLAILALAAVLRIYGLDHGLPFVYNPDEANIMARALSISQNLDPNYYLYPSFFFYLIFAAMGGLYVVGRLFGRYENVSAFTVQFFEDPTDFYLVGRLIGVVAALATIVVTYHLATKHFGRTVGRISALFITVAYFHVRDAHYLKHDVPAGLLFVLALWASDWALVNGGSKRFAVAGVVLGAAFATHYYMIFLAPAFVLCHWFYRRLQPATTLFVAGMGSAVTFFMLSPFVVLKLPLAMEHMHENRRVVVDRSLEVGGSFFPSLGKYFRFLAEQGLGYMMVGLIVIGMVLMIRKSGRHTVLWWSFPLLFLGFISYTFFAGRYLNPVLSTLAVTAAVAVNGVADRFGKRAAMCITALACLQPLMYSINVDRLFASEDTRTLARRKILKEAPNGETFSLQSYSVPLPQSPESFRESLTMNNALHELDRGRKFSNLLAVAETERKSFRLYFFGKGDEKNRIYLSYEELASGLEALRTRGIRRVVLSYSPGPPQPEVASLFEYVRREGHLIHRVTPFVGKGENLAPYLDNEDWPVSSSLRYKGPVVEVWLLEQEVGPPETIR